MRGVTSFSTPCTRLSQLIMCIKTALLFDKEVKFDVVKVTMEGD